MNKRLKHWFYEYKCDHRQEWYTGETRRHLASRMQEHIQGKYVRSEIAMNHHLIKKRNLKLSLYFLILT